MKITDHCDKITVIGNERDRITRDSQITVLANTRYGGVTGMLLGPV